MDEILWKVIVDFESDFPIGNQTVGDLDKCGLCHQKGKVGAPDFDKVQRNTLMQIILPKDRDISSKTAPSPSLSTGCLSKCEGKGVFCTDCCTIVSQLLEAYRMFQKTWKRFRDIGSGVCYKTLRAYYPEDEFSSCFNDWNRKRLEAIVTKMDWDFQPESGCMQEFSKSPFLEDLAYNGASVECNIVTKEDDKTTIISVDNLVNVNYPVVNKSLKQMKNEKTKKSLSKSKFSEVLADKVGKLQEPIYGNCLICNICDKSFLTKRSLASHKKNHAEKTDGQFDCSHCDIKFETFQDLDTHQKTHRVQIDFCSICKKSLSKNRLRHHLYSHYIKDSSLSNVSCHICSKRFENPLLLSDHVRIHLGRLSCKVECCKKGFNSSSALENHRNKVHEGKDRLFDCDYCSSYCETACELKNHIQTHEAVIQKKYLCDTCGLSFLNREVLNRHKRTVHSKTEFKFKCEICNKAFTSGFNLNSHKRLHSGINPFSCTKCSMSFNRRIQLEMHMRKHTGIMPYKCSYCEHPGFSYIKGLRQHIFKIHNDTQGASRVCDICYKDFPDDLMLADHKSVHEKLKCRICSKQFKMTTHLKEHLLRHAKLKPYKCSVCLSTNADFIRQKQLIDHMKTVHPNDPLPTPSQNNITYILELS